MIYLLPAFLSALLAAAVLTPTVRLLARSFGIVAPPVADRWHQRPTALLGGVAIFSAVLLSVAFTLAYGFEADLAASGFGSREVGILLSAGVMFLTGLADDRFKLRPSWKLILQGTAAAILVSLGVVWRLTPWEPGNIILTLFWFIALTNALNLLDNMDGVAAGVTAIAGLFLATTFALEGEWLLAALCAGVAGATAGFLPYNFHPASIFMGDSGSLTLGALLAGLGAAYPTTASTSIVSVFFIPVFIVAIPIVDAVAVTTVRTLTGRPVSEGGRDHAAHRLVGLGLTEKQTAILLYGFAAAGGLVALVVRSTGVAFGLSVGTIFLVALLVLAAYLAQFKSEADAGGQPDRRITVLVSNLLYKRRALEVLLDLLLFAIAYYGAHLLRYDGSLPPAQVDVLERTLALAVVSKSLAFGLSGVYRGVWRQMSVIDMHRLLQATLLGSLLTVAGLVFFFRADVFARGVLVIDGLLVAILTIAARGSFRSLDMVRQVIERTGPPTLIYGAGKGGELVLRELRGNPDHQLQAVGFLDDDPNKHGSLVHGVPVLGGSQDLDSVVARRKVDKVVIATEKLTPDRLEAVRSRCRELDLELLSFEFRIRPVSEALEDDPPLMRLK